MSRTGRDTLPVVWDGWEAHPEVRDWFQSPPRGPRLVQILSRRSGSSREALPKVRELSGGYPGGPRGVGSLYRRFGTGLEAFLKVLDGSGGPS